METYKVFREFFLTFHSFGKFSGFYAKLLAFFLIFLLFFSGNFFTLSEGVFLTSLSIVQAYLFVNIVLSLIRLFLIYAYYKKNNFPSDHIDTYTIGIQNLFSLFLIGIMFFMVLHILGIEIKSLFLTVSIIASAIAVTFKEYITNMLNGFIIMFSNDYKILDLIKVGEIQGKIVNIDFQKVHIRTLNGNMIYIPNGTIFSTTVINLSRMAGNKEVPFTFSIGSEVYAEFDELKKILEEISAFSEQIKSVDSVKIVIQSVQKDAVTISVLVPVNRYSTRLEFSLNNVINTCVMKFASSIKTRESSPSKKRKFS